MKGRLKVVPDALRSTGSAFSRSAESLQQTVAKLRSATGSIQWEGEQKAALEERMREMSAQADRMRSFLVTYSKQLHQVAELYEQGDEEGKRGVGGLASAVAGLLGRIPAVQTIYGAVAKTIQFFGPRVDEGGAIATTVPALGVAAGGAAAAMQVREMDEPAAPPTVSNRERPRPAHVPPGPAETRLPNAAELDYMKWIFGIDEEGYGPKTRAAVADFQRRKGIAPDAEVMIGPNTWSQLERFAEYREGPLTEPEVRLGAPFRLSDDGGFGITAHMGDDPDDYKVNGWSHWGADLVPTGKTESTVTSTTDGTVLYAGLDPRTASNGPSIGFGNVVVVKADDGTILVYAHMQDELKVSPGQRLGTGAPLGEMGDSGAAKGAHLHLELWRGLSGEFVDGGAQNWELALRSFSPSQSGAHDPLAYLHDQARSRLVE